MIVELQEARRSPYHPPVIIADRDINVYALAKQLKISQGSLSRFLSGNGNPTLEYAKKIAAALGMTYIELLAAIDTRKDELCQKVS